MVVTPSSGATTSLTSNKPIETTPLNVSIRLPDDMNERKNLIKRNLDHTDLKDVKFNADSIKTELKKPQDIKEEQKDEKFKTELIIPKVSMDKVTVKEENDSGSEIAKDDGGYMPQGLPPMGYNPKEPHLNHLHPLNLKESPDSRSKEQIMNLSHTPYMKDPQYPYNQQKEPLIKVEPHDEPIELTKTDIYNQPVVSQPLNIPTVIPMSQAGRMEGQFEEEKKEKLERPERVDRPERSDLGGMSTPIGQPPLPSLMQSGNLVTIGGGQPPMNHYNFMSSLPYPHPQSPRPLDKNQIHLNPPTSQPLPATAVPQNEPQNLKIKQEVADPAPPHMPMPAYSQAAPIPSSYTPTSGSYTPSSLPPPPMNDPLQSLKDVKVPGFNLPSAVSQTISGGDRPPSGPIVDIKKEPEFSGQRPASSSPARSPVTKSPALKPAGTPTGAGTISQTPPLRQSSK